ncbi:MAG: NAD-dependent epimerase/dehydratase family protein [Planctomycetota bacterium]|jgi:UDP-glucose 4-epimerase
MNVSGDKFVVTGGAGFIGSHLCEELLGMGKRVVSVDNYVYNTRHNIVPLLDDVRFTAVNADITDLQMCAEAFLGADVVFNLAASKCTYCASDPALDLRVNAGGALEVGRLALNSMARKLVHVSTGSAYGPVEEHIEDVYPYKPVSFYGVSKLAGERYMEALRETHKLNYSIARYYHVYGPRQKGGPYGGVIPIFIERILRDRPLVIYGDGQQTRSFTYVKDVVKATLMLAENKDADGEAFNVASGVPVTIAGMAYMLMDIMDKKVPVRFEDRRKGDIDRFSVSNEKIKRVGMTDWTAFEDGIKDTVDWYVDQFEKEALYA